jgi:cupin fold WbuC family metalloprotein
MDIIRESEEVYRTRGYLTVISAEDIKFLKDRAKANVRKRIRLCAHPDSQDPLHEMLIVHMNDAYVPPHKHISKSESFHIIEGKLTVFIFDDNGNVKETIKMGDLVSGRIFYYRMSSSLFHTVWPESEFVVFHEVTNGPFDRRQMIIAPWAPGDDDLDAQKVFRSSLASYVKGDANG